jgi:cytochrome c peroxidase
MKQHYSMATLLAVTLLFGLTGCETPTEPEVDNATLNQKKITLGKALFNDKNLSLNRTMACATCHQTGSAMIDPRGTAAVGASLGDDDFSRSDRNAPTAAYAKFSPSFYFDSGEGLYMGGQFHDGSAKDLKAQAKGPFLNPVEMMMPSASAVIDRIKENNETVAALKSIYGDTVFDDDDKAYDAVADSIALFETSDVFSPFNSRYDRFLAGDEELTPLEIEGLALFEGKAMCSACHPSTTDDGSRALLTDFSYDNLGVPVNHALRQANGLGDGYIDNGLGAREEINDPALNGAFKVATLRNIAVTGPYMHNGLFKDLKTVVHFYNTRDTGGINPETNSSWEAAEVDATKNVAELGDLGLTDAEEDALVAFMKTLTDKQYEPLIPAE